MSNTSSGNSIAKIETAAPISKRKVHGNIALGDGPRPADHVIEALPPPGFGRPR